METPHAILPFRYFLASAAPAGEAMPAEGGTRLALLDKVRDILEAVDRSNPRSDMEIELARSDDQHWKPAGAEYLLRHAAQRPGDSPVAPVSRHGNESNAFRTAHVKDPRCRGALRATRDGADADRDEAVTSDDGGVRAWMQSLFFAPSGTPILGSTGRDHGTLRRDLSDMERDNLGPESPGQLRDQGHDGEREPASVGGNEDLARAELPASARYGLIAAGERPQDEHRNVAGEEDFLSDAAEHPLVGPGTAVRAHRNKSDVFVSRDVQDSTSGILFPNDPSRPNPRLPKPVREIFHVLPGLCRTFGEQHCVVGAPQGTGNVCGSQDECLGVGSVEEQAQLSEHRLGALRTVYRDKDLFEHVFNLGRANPGPPYRPSTGLNGSEG
jgi:hypothetical protein